MAANTVNGSGNGARSGAQTLVLLATPLSCRLLDALSAGSAQQAELRRRTGSPAQTTLRAQMNKLVEIGAVAKRRRSGFPGPVEYDLTASGRELLFVMAVAADWLAHAPDGPLALTSSTGRVAIKALVEGWSTNILRALAARPHSLTELDRVIGCLNYPSLERRLGAMRLTGQIEARTENGRGTPYAVTDWLRNGIAPLATAARWELRHLPEPTAPISRIDIEAAFLLVVPLLRLPAELSGSCRMAVELPSGKERRLAGVIVEASEGRIASCATRLHGHPDAWALGSSGAWLSALIEGGGGGLELGGDSRLARHMVEGLHKALFPGALTPQFQ